jgi:thymidylate kinase
MRAAAAVSIFIDVDPAVGRQRVLARDGEVSADHIEAWQAQEQAHFEADRTRDAVSITLRS